MAFTIIEVAGQFLSGAYTSCFLCFLINPLTDVALKCDNNLKSCGLRFLFQKLKVLCGERLEIGNHREKGTPANIPIYTMILCDR